MNEQITYYQKRAKEYELIYQKPERQTDLTSIKDFLSNQFHDKTIMEIACGTGYWTEILARNAKSVYAIDINPEVLEIARTKNYPKQNVKFEAMDLEYLKRVSGHFEGLFGGFIWSHIRREDLMDFVKMAINQVKKGSEIIFLDNKYVEGSSTPVSRTDEQGNTFQLRQLTSGEEFEVLKNFPTQQEIKNLTEEVGSDFKWIEWEYYWMVRFKKTFSSAVDFFQFS